MKHVLLPNNTRHRLPFYLAMEEFLAARDNEDYFFMWQVNPTVIIGRNQQLLNEVNTDYCRSAGIDIARRRSGGGCVYADDKNIMFSYITTSDQVTDTFGSYTATVAAMLRSLGVPAQAGGRNDVLIGDRKVSGNAFYHRRGRAIVHGTMLYDTDVNEMLKAITPSSVKLTGKGVESVRSRVTNLTEHFDLPIEAFKQAAAAYMCDDILQLDDNDVDAIKLIEQNYYDPMWLRGNSPRATVTKSMHTGSVGEITASIALDGDRIEHLALTGDYFLLSDLDTGLINHVTGSILDRDALAAALATTDTSLIIAGLSTQQFIDLLLS